MREYYDRRAAEYDATITDGLDEVTTAALAEESAALDRVLAALPPAPTLDVGCGTGGLTRHLPGQVVALDQSQGMLRIARSRVPAAQLVCAAVPPIPFADGSFERIFTSHFYGHLLETERAAFLTEARRVAPELVVEDYPMRITDPLYALYTRRLHRQVTNGPLPNHVGLIMDGNRRWARQMGMTNPSLGHQYGAEHTQDVLAWCQALGINHVTVFVCSTENLQRRNDTEVAFLMQVIEQMVTDKLSGPDARWQLHIAGTLDILPDTTARALKQAVEATRACATGAHVTLAIGYGGRQEVVDAVGELLHERAAVGQSPAELAASLTVEDITGHLSTAGQPEPDLVIRTSGEQRLSNFLLWQSVDSELYFCEAYWPAFRELDFLRALRSFAARKRRYGS